MWETAKSWRLEWVLLATILVASAWLRFHVLGRAAPWIDEITIASFAAPPKTPTSLTREIFAAGLKGFTGQHMPLQYVLANEAQRRAARAAPADGVAILRAPFAWAGVLTVPLFGLLLGRWYGRAAGWWGAVLLGVSFFHVYQSRDATSYAPLLLFQAAAMLGAQGLMADGLKSWRSIGHGALLAAGLLGALFTHLTAWFFLLTLGAVAVGAAAWSVLHVRDKNSSLGRALAPALALALLAGLCGLPFLQFPLAAAGGAGGSVGGQAEPLTLDLFLYQVAAFGWGRGDGRLLAFAAAWAWGVVSSSRRSSRGQALVHAALLVLPLILFFSVLKRDFFPRYLAIAYLPFLAYAVFGLADLTERARRWRTWAGLAVSASVLALLVAWHVAPYNTLFAQQDKYMPMSRVRDWLVRTVPEGGLFMWRNGYHMRDVPGALPVPGRQAVYADHPNAGIPREEYARRSAAAKSVFQRFPEAVLLNDPVIDDFPELWTWPATEFTHREVLREDAVARLWAWGFSPHGVRQKEAPWFIGCHRTREEIVQARQASGAPSAWPTGQGWLYRQTSGGETLVAPVKSGAPLAVVVPRPGLYGLACRGIVQAPVRLSLWRVRGGSWEKLGEDVVGASQAWRSQWGPWELQPGDQLAWTAFPEGEPLLYVYDFELAAR